MTAGAVIAAITLPAVWLARGELQAYYVGQAVTDTKVRAQEFGAPGVFSYWIFYLHSLIVDHLGKVCCALALVVLAVLLFAARPRPRVSDDKPYPIMVLFVAVMCFIPLSVLTLWPLRNPIVVNILITPAIGLMLIPVIAHAGGSKPGSLPSVSPILGILAALALGCGILMELGMAARRTYLSGDKDSVRNVLRLHDEIAVHSRKMGWHSPRISCDRVQEYLIPALISALAYERHGFFLQPVTALGNIVQPVPPASALQAIESSDFAVITDMSSAEGPGFAFPFNIAMKQMQPQLHATVERYLVPIGRFQAFTHQFTLYMRPAVQTVGDSGGWITSQGLTLVAPAETLRARPNIELRGTTILAEHLGKTAMKAEMTTAHGELVEAAVKFDLQVAPKSASQYEAMIHLDVARMPADGEVKVKVSFDKFFVPKEIGLNADPRQLVVMTPKQVRLLP